MRFEDRVSFLYFEHCRVNRSDNAITVTDADGTVYVPSARLSVLMLGPGSAVTHDAMTVIGESGSTVVWVGEHGVRMYAFGRPLTHSSVLLQQQARLVTNTRSKLDVARRKYAMRFPNEDVSKLSMQQLRGREGVRVRRIYGEWSKRTGVEWSRREYDPTDYDNASEINKALSSAHTCLYALAHSAIVALGCSPGLGFVHTGHENSFVYDIADLYKAELSIPVAFEVAAEQPTDIGSETRRRMRDRVFGLRILARMVSDIKDLLLPDETVRDQRMMMPEIDHVGLWDERIGEVDAGKSYGDEDGE